MPRRSQTEVAVLGALSAGPMSGYEVRTAITTTLGHFWHESFGQIYPTIARLETEGSVRRASSRSGEKGEKLVLTASGRRRLKQLLAEPYERRPPRNGLLLRVFFGDQLGRDATRRLLTDAVVELRERASELDALDADPADPADPSDEVEMYRRMTLDYGRRMAAAQLDWAEACLAELDR